MQNEVPIISELLRFAQEGGPHPPPLVGPISLQILPMPLLLGHNWLQKLRLDWPEIHQLQETGTLERILQKHQQVFKEELGEIKGIKAQISIDPQAQPRFCKPRPVPFALRNKVEMSWNNSRKRGLSRQ